MSDDTFEDDFWDLCERTDNLQRVLALAVSIIETGLIKDMDVQHAFLTKAEDALNDYYQNKLPYSQYKKLNKKVKA